MFTSPLLLTIYAGFTHAFEADHLLAVSNIVSRRDSIKSSLKDGIFWGLGHASVIFFIGLCMILFKSVISAQYFQYFEVIVGLMLIGLAVYRLLIFFRNKKIIVHANTHLLYQQQHKYWYSNVDKWPKYKHTHSLAYGIGLIHGLGGSGALIVIIMSQMTGPVDGLTYLVIFGLGCIAGMMLASGLFSIPFSKRIMKAHPLQSVLIIISSVLCLLYGSKVIYENLLT